MIIFLISIITINLGGNYYFYDLVIFWHHKQKFQFLIVQDNYMHAYSSALSNNLFVLADILNSYRQIFGLCCICGCQHSLMYPLHQLFDDATEVYETGHLFCTALILMLCAYTHGIATTYMACL